MITFTGSFREVTPIFFPVLRTSVSVEILFVTFDSHEFVLIHSFSFGSFQANFE